MSPWCQLERLVCGGSVSQGSANNPSHNPSHLLWHISLGCFSYRDAGTSVIKHTDSSMLSRQHAEIALQQGKQRKQKPKLVQQFQKFVQIQSSMSRAAPDTPPSHHAGINHDLVDPTAVTLVTISHAKTWFHSADDHAIYQRTNFLHNDLLLNI